MWIKKGSKVTKKFRTTDEAFSRLIRFRTAEGKGYCKCITCGAVLPPEDMDAGHYISRGVMPLRYDERNVHPQCRTCNRFREGMKDEYALALIKLYGPDILEELKKEKESFKIYTDLELKEMRKEYRKLIKEL